MTAGYFGDRGTHLMQAWVPDAATFVYITSRGRSDRHAGTVIIRRRLEKGFTAAVEYALAQVKARPQARPIGEACPECGGDLVERHGSQGAFIGCSNYPQCSYTRNLEHKPLVLHPAEG